jgi:prepilin peptidase CpaA
MRSSSKCIQVGLHHSDPCGAILNPRVTIAPIRTARRTLSEAPMSDAIPAGVLLHLGTLVIATALLGVAALNDVATRTIPDFASLGLVLIGVVLRGASNELPAALGASAAVFLLGAASWRLGWIGGGDVKLLAACAWLVSPALVPRLVLTTAIAGGGLACVYLTLRWLFGAARAQTHAALSRSLVVRIWRVERRRIERRPTLPYGCAIAVGTLLTLASG